VLDRAALLAVREADMRTDIGITHAAYDDVQKRESVHRLPHHPALIALYRTLFGREPLVHPRHIVRLPTPHPAMTPTPPHQDFPLIQGTANTWTCWFPVGDCPRTLGGLTVLRASHKLGYLPIRPSLGAGLIASELCPGEDEWVEGDFETGDVLTFPSLTVHKALPSQFRDRIRLSMDVRYQPADEPVEARSLLPHCGLTWEQIYADWEADDLKYYWERVETTPAPWDPALLQPSRRLC
jgi:ectoine hydroxylase-related dioxygenase (phytanoyl-CoA dioxygenase family)